MFNNLKLTEIYRHFMLARVIQTYSPLNKLKKQTNKQKIKNKKTQIENLLK